MKDFFSYYEILDVAENADTEAIKSAYRSKALKYHPDRVPEHLKKKSEEIFKQISEAYEVLSDPEKRKQYDEGLKNLKTGQASGQTGYPGNPVLQVDKTYFEFKNLKWGTVVSDYLSVSNAGSGILTGTITPFQGWVSLSQNIIDTPDIQEIEITIDTTILLAGQGYSETIEIQTNGGNKTVYIDISTEVLSNTDVIISLIRSVIPKHLLKASVIFCGTILGLWIFWNGMTSSYKNSAPALSPVSQVGPRERPASVSESARVYPPAPVFVPPPAPPRRYIVIYIRPSIRLGPPRYTHFARRRWRR